ncbi:chitobiase/beta-hexosaminidase C-terminal domain-containing protein, partial [bacterium]|nr:chitobiase/beta-hexosaminidase C-terminal domain-containing protein [bacterium]
MLLTAADGDREYQKTGVPAELQKRAKSWSDLRRGLAVARASWDKDALFVHYECRSDFFYAGHETPEHGDFTLSAHGVLWSPYSGPYMDCYFRNMVLIDGRAGVYQPVAGRMVGVYDSPAAAIFVSDATDGYNWRKLEKLFELDHEMLRSAWIFAEWEKDNAFKLDRHTEMPFHPHMREFYEGFAHLDWGPWHGETRGPERYQRWNDVRRVYRTLHVARGKAPYVLIVDDVQKDDQPHQYDWCFNLTSDAVLYKAASKARNRHLTNDTEGAIGTDLILCLANTPNRQSQTSGLASHRVSVKPQPKTGDPMLLVRVLWRNTTFPYPLPSFEETWGWKRVKVPAMAVEPEFRVMLFPHRFGDKLPMTKWSDDRTQLTVKFDGQTDVYTFGKTEDERTVFAMERNGKPAARIDSKPPKPVLRQARGAELVYKGPWDDVAPVAPAEYGKVCLLTDDVTLAFEPSPRGCEIRYTLDGTEPTRASTLYKGQFEIENSAKIRAKTYHRRWLFGGDGASDTLSVDYEKVEPLTPATLPEAPDEDMDVRVYEIKTSIYDERGFFTGTKKMLPDLDRHKPIFRGGASDFSGHIVHPEAPAREMKKAFTRYRGYFEAGSHGVYGFDVESCGPVLLTVGGRKVIEATGQYGLSWKSRIGQVALAKGWHRFELVVTDPVFWKGGMEPRRGTNVRHWCPERFGYVPTSTVVRGDVPEWAPEAPWMLLAKGGPEKDTAPGLIENRFDWTGSAPADGRVPANGLPRDYFRDIEAAKPYARGAALVLGGNDTLARVIEYRGFFRAVTFGDYSFRLDAKGGNQLVIDAHVVAQNRMQGGRPSGRIILDPGLYPISLRIAKGKGTLEMKGPLDGDFQPVSMADLLRPKDFKPVAGSTAPVAHVTFDAKEKVSILNASVVDGGRKGKGVELKATNAKVVLDGVKMLDDACTVALWLKRERVTDGILLDAPNKLSIRLRNRIIWASYYRSPDIAMANAGNAIDVGKWFHLAVTWGDEVRVYLDGKLLGSAQVDRSAFHTPGTDARAEKFVFFTDTWDRGLVPGIADEMRVYNRVLPLAEIQAIARDGGR